MPHPHGLRGGGGDGDEEVEVTLQQTQASPVFVKAVVAVVSTLPSSSSSSLSVIMVVVGGSGDRSSYCRRRRRRRCVYPSRPKRHKRIEQKNTNLGPNRFRGRVFFLDVYGASHRNDSHTDNQCARE